LNVEGHPVLESIFFSRFAVPTQPLAGTCSRTPQALKRCVAVHWATVARMVRLQKNLMFWFARCQTISMDRKPIVIPAWPSAVF
jgi:hypothetical protein